MSNGLENEKVQTRTFPFQHGVSPITTTLIERLKTGKQGDVITDEEIQAITGLDCSPNHRGYGKLQTAIRRCLHDFNILWERQRNGRCILCLNDLQIAERTGNEVSGVRRKTRRAIDKSAIVDVAKLPGPERLSFSVRQIQLGAARLFTENRTAKQLQLRGIITEPEPVKMLEAFMRISKNGEDRNKETGP